MKTPGIVTMIGAVFEQDRLTLRMPGKQTNRFRPAVTSETDDSDPNAH